MRGLDFRDAQLEDAEFTACDLPDVRFRNASLKGAKFTNCTLHGVDFSYADLAGASLTGSTLAGARLADAKVLQLDLAGADLIGAIFDPDTLPWELVLNWRAAKFDAGVKERLIARFEEEPRGPRVLMLMWEIPPLVAGGSWTACYHLVRNLRRQGADITVVVPWDRAIILDTPPFGCEVEVVPLGIKPPRGGTSPYAAPSWSPYGSIYGSGWAQPSPYDRAAPPWSPYSASGPYFAGSTYSVIAGAGAYSSPVLRLMDEFRRALTRLMQQRQCDIIHAHDWVTFEAAADVARQFNKPWVAHFHSTERERRPQAGLTQGARPPQEPDPIIERIERRAAIREARLIAPSNVTAARIAQNYAIDMAG